MKYSLAVLALIGVVSSRQLSHHNNDSMFVGTHHKKHHKKPSDEVANGDEKEDLENQHENDPTDPVVQDHGFGTDARLWTLSQKRHHHRKPSDEVANGDEKEDLENQHENDPNDPIVQDHGFGTDARLWTLSQKRHHHVKPSDEVANGDEKEDLENQHENDPNDPIVQDHGFGTDARLWTLHQRRAFSQAQKKHHHQKHHKKPSDEVANGDEKEDLENQHENDPNDPIVQDHGFGTDARLWTLHQRRAFSNAQKSRQHRHRKPSDEVANGDEKEDLENQNENDPNDQVVQDHGFGTDARLWTLHQRSAPRSHHNYLQLQAYRPSDEVANGDTKEDLQLENERDDDDAIVQDHGFGLDAKLFLQTKAAHHMSNQMKEKIIEMNEYGLLQLSGDGNGEYEALSNTDWNDNRQVEDENDPDDPIVQDTGFGTASRLWK